MVLVKDLYDNHNAYISGLILPEWHKGAAAISNGTLGSEEKPIDSKASSQSPLSCLILMFFTVIIGERPV